MIEITTGFTPHPVASLHHIVVHYGNMGCRPAEAYYAELKKESRDFNEPLG
jgi:hypothetical protein